MMNSLDITELAFRDEVGDEAYAIADNKNRTALSKRVQQVEQEARDNPPRCIQYVKDGKALNPMGAALLRKHNQTQ